MHNDSVFRQLCVEHMDINIPFFNEQSICGIRCHTDVSQKIIDWTFFKKRWFTYFFLDVIDD